MPTIQHIKTSPFLGLIVIILLNTGITFAQERAVPYAINKNTLQGSKKTETQPKYFFEDNNDSLLIFTLSFTVITFALTYLLIRSKHKRERFMEAYLTETRIAKKVHDEIANEIYAAMNYLSSEREISGSSKEAFLSRLDDIYLMTKNISRETNSIDTGYNYPEHLKLMLTSYYSDNTNIIVKGMEDVNWNEIDPLKKIATYRSLQEMMINMKKHSAASLVIVDFHLSGKKIEISYTDNGRGASTEQLLSKNGLKNVENRLASVDGTIDINTGNNKKGFHALLTYPIYTPYVPKNLSLRRY